jgi:hypothetical protein
MLPTSVFGSRERLPSATEDLPPLVELAPDDLDFVAGGWGLPWKKIVSTVVGVGVGVAAGFATYGPGGAVAGGIVGGIVGYNVADEDTEQGAPPDPWTQF